MLSTLPENDGLLCIGGPKDGQKIWVSEYSLRSGRFEIDISPKVTLLDTPMNLSFKTAYYQLKQFAGEKHLHSYWQFQVLTSDEVINKLFLGYKP